MLYLFGDCIILILVNVSLLERVVVDGHGCDTAINFDVKAEESQDKVPTL